MEPIRRAYNLSKVPGGTRQAEGDVDMTIEELYGKVLADDELKESLAKAVAEGTLAEWMAA